MDIFNIVVGVFSILGSIASIVSMTYLHNISVQQKNSGDNNNNQSQMNKGKENENTIIQY